MKLNINYTHSTITSILLLFSSLSSPISSSVSKDTIINNIKKSLTEAPPKHNTSYQEYSHKESHTTGIIKQKIKITKKIAKWTHNSPEDFVFGIKEYNHNTDTEISYSATGGIIIGKCKYSKQMPNYDISDIIDLELNIDKLYVKFCHKSKEKAVKVDLKGLTYSIFVRYPKHKHQNKTKIFQWQRFSIKQKKHKPFIKHSQPLLAPPMNRLPLKKRIKKITNPRIILISIGYHDYNSTNNLRPHLAQVQYTLFENTLCYHNLFSNFQYYYPANYLSYELLEHFLKYIYHSHIINKYDGTILYIIGKENQGNIITSKGEAYSIKKMAEKVQEQNIPLMIFKDTYKEAPYTYPTLSTKIMRKISQLNSNSISLSQISSMPEFQNAITYHNTEADDLELQINIDAATEKVRKRVKQLEKVMNHKVSEIANLKNIINQMWLTTHQYPNGSQKKYQPNNYYNIHQ